MIRVAGAKLQRRPFMRQALNVRAIPMLSWRKTLTLSALLALACTAAEAQYTPGAPGRPQPYAGPPAAQPYAVQPYATPVASPYAGATYASPSQNLHAALEAARGRDLDGARAYQMALSDPLARKIVDWALVDVFGEQLGLVALEQGARDLAGWPREDSRTEAVNRLRSGGVSAPGGPVPYAALGPSSGAAESNSSRQLGERRRAMTEALRAGDASAAYSAIANHGLLPDVNWAEAEAYAGWLALNKLRNPTLAEQHFARLDAYVKSPVSKARAAYWRGRTAEVAGDPTRARAFYEQGAQHTTTFYGQLAAERAGRSQIVLAPDPVATAEDRATVEGSEALRAVRLLAQAGEKSLVKVFGQHLGDIAPNGAQLGLYVDQIKAMGEQELSLLAYRRGAQRGLILHERGYPLRTPPAVIGAPEPGLVLAIVRQESQFDPRVRSHADARGMMQLLPSTGREMAGKIGISWDESALWDADYNMRLGAHYLGRIVNQFDGSYIMAAAGYNAGPSRPQRWVEFCGDPRSASVDPLDFIECVPFSETRNYIMNVMSNMQVYRARLNGGSAPLTPSQDLKRGGYGYAVAPIGGYQPTAAYRTGGF